MDQFNIAELVRTRNDQPEFHVASERHVRVEFRNMHAGEKLGPVHYSGDLVVTCYRGQFTLCDGKECRFAGELDQVVVPEDSHLEIECVEGGTLQIIWAPAFAPTAQV